jgi:hypothetical protein
MQLPARGDPARPPRRVPMRFLSPPICRHHLGAGRSRRSNSFKPATPSRGCWPSECHHPVRADCPVAARLRSPAGCR